MNVRRHSCLLAAATLVLVVSGGCSALPAGLVAALQPTADASVTPASETTRPSPQPLPQRTFIVRQDGIRATVRFDRMPLIAGKPNYATTTVTNIGTNDVTWSHDTCASTIGGWATIDAPIDMGIEQPGNLGAFKQFALDPLSRGAAWVRFLPADMVRDGEHPCSDIAIGDRIEPGQSIRQRIGWNGQIYPLLGLPVDGSVTLRLKFETYWRPGLPHPGRPNGQIDISGTAWISGGADPSRLDAPQIVDSALHDPRLAELAQNLRVGTDGEPICWYRPDTDNWWVGAFFDDSEVGTDRYSLQYAVVDPVTGAVSEIVVRPWDEQTDPLPL